MYKKKQKEMPGLTPAAWRKAAAQEMGVDYNTFLSLWKEAKSASKAAKLVPESIPTKVAAEAGETVTMGLTTPTVVTKAPKVPYPNATKVKKIMEDKYIHKSGYTKAQYTHTGQMYGGGAKKINGYKSVHSLGPADGVKIEFDIGVEDYQIKALGSKFSDEGWFAKIDGKSMQVSKNPIEGADYKPKWASQVTPAKTVTAGTETAEVTSVANDAVEAAVGEVQTSLGIPLSNDLVKSIYKDMKKAMPGGTPAVWRKAAAEYLEVSYNDFLVAWKTKGAASDIAKIKKLPTATPKNTPLSASTKGKYKTQDIGADQLKQDLAELYGPGANPVYISLSYNDATGVYKVQFPSSLIKTQAAKDAVVQGLKDLGLNVTKSGDWYNISSAKAKQTAEHNLVQIKQTGTYTLPDGTVALDMTSANNWTNQWWNKLSEATRSAWKSYTGSGYHDMNGYLRGTANRAYVSAHTQKNIQLVSKSMQRVEHEFTVFRGTMVDINKFTQGGLWSDEGFMSTAVNPGGSWGGVKFEITMTPGSRGMYIGKKSSHPGENEFLIDKGTKFRVLSVNKSTQTVKLVAIPKG